MRRTLATLVAAGAVHAERQLHVPAAGPCLRYRLVGTADEPFKAILPMLLELLDSSPSSAQTDYATDFAHGTSTPAPGSGGTREALVASLANYGFAPVEQTAEPPAPTILDLTRCPFRDAVTGSANGRQICHLHHGLLAGIATANGGELKEFAINDPRFVPCRVHFSERRVEQQAQP